MPNHRQAVFRLAVLSSKPSWLASYNKLGCRWMRFPRLAYRMRQRAARYIAATSGVCRIGPSTLERRASRSRAGRDEERNHGCQTLT